MSHDTLPFTILKMEHAFTTKHTPKKPYKVSVEKLILLQSCFLLLVDCALCESEMLMLSLAVYVAQ